MKFKALPVTSLEDVTVDLEQLSARDILDQTGESVLQLAVTGSKVAVAFGTVTFVFTAAVASASVVVSHGIGRTPRVWVQSQNNLLASVVTAKSSSTFTANGFVTSNTATTATVSMDWVAIG